jgi:TBCC domain-containing protein 1
MFLLVHCEGEAFLRCTSGDDDRRFADHAESPGGRADGGGVDPALDFAALLHNRSLSPRTRLHASSSPGAHKNNANCAAFLLRHLRKFLLLCAVPRHALACRALATLAARGVGGGGGGGGGGGRSSRNAVNNLDIATILQQHQREHGTIGLNVELTIEELDRLHLVLQAPSGGLVDEPPIAIGEHVLKCLALEELEAHRKSKSPLAGPNTIRWNLMQNGLVTVSDAERVLRRYLEEELTMAKTELDGEDHHHVGTSSAAMPSSDVTPRLSTLSPGVSPIQPGSASRSRGASITSDSADAAKDGSSYLKELSYQNLRSTTVLLEPGKDNTLGGGGGGGATINNDGTSGSVTSADQHSQASSTTPEQVNAAAAASHHQPMSTSSSSSPANESGRLHDLHVADCSDTHFYLLQPFEHATIAACTDCTIVLGAVAGLLHVVDCERTTITAAARRVVVSNSCDVVHYVFTPSPPLVVGDNRGCQFAPYNTYYEGLREDLLATGLAALLRSATSSGSVGGSVAGDSAASPGRGGEAGVRCMSPTALPTLQCASNKWKVPVGE